MTGSSRATKARQLGDNPPRLVLGEQLGRRSPAGLILGAVFHDKAGVQFLDRPGRREATLRSLRQARHSLKLEDQPQRGHRIVDVATAGRMVQPIRNAPGALLAAFGRQMAEQGANVAQRSQRRDGRDLERSR